MSKKRKFSLALRNILLIGFALILNEGIALSQEGSEFVGKYPVLNFLYGVAVDSSGNVYVVDRNNHRIQKFDSKGNFITKWGGSGGNDREFRYPYGVAVDSSGNVYVVDRNNHRIQKFDSKGNFITKWGGSGGNDGQLNRPSGVAVDLSGNVYVADTLNCRIQKFDSNGNFITKWGNSGGNDREFHYPYGVAVDLLGNVYVADTLNCRIQKFDPNGNFITKWGGSGGNDGEFRYPYGVAVDSSGNVYVADTLNHRIQKFDSNGNFITKWGSPGSGEEQFRYSPSELIIANSSEPLGDTICGREVFKSDTITYTLSYECRGDIFIDNVRIIDHLDPGLSPLSYDGEYDASTHTLTWHLGRLGPNDSGTLVFIAQVIADSGTCIKNYATVSADNIDNIPKGILTHYVMQVSPPVIYVSPHSPATAADHLGDVVVYPNPFKPYKNHERIYFGHPNDQTRRLTREATIKIYDITGVLVKTIKEPDDDGIEDGVATWDGKNEDEKDVASGVYIYYITNPEGEKCVGKIGIIR